MHEFFAESFDLENTFENILSIQVNLNGFSFSILNPKTGEVIAFKAVPLKISSDSLLARRFKEWFESEDVLQKTFQKIRVIIFSEKFTLVPKSNYSANLKDELAYALFKGGNQLKFAENLVNDIDAKLLFTIPEDLLETFTDTLGDCQIVHPVKLLMNCFNKGKIENEIVLLFNNHDLTIAVRSGGKLTLVNSFKINHANDVVYFVLTALKQLQIQSQTTHLFYGGQSSFQQNIEDKLAKYFSSIKRLSIKHNSLPKEQITENISLFL